MNKLNFTIAVCFFFFACSEEEMVSQNKETNDWEIEGWNIVWQDEFDKDSLDLTKWSREIGGHGWGNNELQFYTDSDSNSYVENGNLILKAQVVPQGIGSSRGLRYYSSARLRTYGKGDWKYGRIEVKAKVASGQGIWPAIWMLPTDWLFGGWPSSGEIDIMEHVGYDLGVVHGSVHTEAYNHKINTQRSSARKIANVDTEFHVYSIIWDKDKISFFIDDVQYFLFENDQQGNYKTWPFDQRFHLLINIAVGGDWPGNPDNSTNFPRKMLVDYVRVYEKSIN
ncbi:MAG: glycoside hydrolase [Candidatus Marinimicrobia bacterium]|nr:glycoside hydrolase [Candidatus Neomarinimicrobiota bacterium]